MFINTAQPEAQTQSFADVQKRLFGTLAKEMRSVYENQRYLVIETTAVGAIRRYVCVTATSGVTNHPRQAVFLPPGFLVTGGGARVNWSGAGNLLTASYPLLGSIHGWQAESKDHINAAPASITVWVIGEEVEGFSP